MLTCFLSTSGKIFDLLPHYLVHYMAVLLFLNGLAVILSIYLTSFGGQVFYCSVSGFTWGGSATGNIIHLKKMFTSVDDKRDAVSVYYFSSGLASLIGPLITGAMDDAFDSFDGPFVMMGISLFLGSALLVPLMIYDRN